MTERKQLILVGIFFITAIFVSIAGGLMIEANILIENNTLEIVNSNAINVAVVLEMTNVLMVLFIAIGLYKLIKKHSDTLAIGYVVMRVVEAVTCMIPAMLVFGIIASDNVDVATSLLAYRNSMVGYMIPLFYSLTGLILYYYFYQTKVVPRYISIWGFIGVFGILLVNLVPIESMILMIFALPIITNELYLGGYLIIQGFKSKKV